MELSEQQLRVLDPDVRVVEAGPGSGKTRALVARFVATASENKGGVALVSFTNAAIDEVRLRTAAAPALLRAPHFVGTIDAFLHRFIVTPAEVGRLGRMPTYRPDYSDLPANMATLRLNGIAGVGVPITAFRKEVDGALVLRESALDELARQYLIDVDAANRRPDLLARAVAVVGGLTNRGHYDANTARVKAFQVLSGPHGTAATERLSRRFREVLLDEAQDCDSAEFAVFRLLAERCRSVLVADPDQAIYEFRGSNPQLFIDYRDEQDPARLAVLSTNYRSTSSICSAVSAFRAAGVADIEAAEVGDCPPVFVLNGSGPQQRAKFLALVQEYELDRTQAIVLSHRRSTARSVAGHDSPDGGSRAFGNRLAGHCCLVRRASSTPAQRMDAMRAIENCLLELIEWPAGEAETGRSHRLQQLGRDSYWLRVSAARVLGELAEQQDRQEFKTTARAVFGQILVTLPFPHRQLGPAIHAPDESVWDKCLTDQPGGVLRFETIHGSKGREYLAALVALQSTLPSDSDGLTVLDDLEHGVNSERRRVLYVGASRAEWLLVIGAGGNRNRVADWLEGQGVPVERR